MAKFVGSSFTAMVTFLIGKLIDSDRVEQLTQNFKEYMIITDDVYNSITLLLHTKGHDDAFHQLLASVKDKQPEEWRIAINSSDFPANEETRELLKLILDATSHDCSDLKTILNRWDTLETMIDTVGEVLEVDVKSLNKNNRLKMVRVVTSMLHKLHSGNVQMSNAARTVIDSVITKAQMDAETRSKRPRSSGSSEGDEKKSSPSSSSLIDTDESQQRERNVEGNTYASVTKSGSYHNSHGPQTRSQTADRGLKESTGESCESGMKIEIGLDSPVHLEDDEYSVELRCLVQHDLPPCSALCIVTSVNNWDPVPMKHIRNFHSVNIKIGKLVGTVYYKFCLLYQSQGDSCRFDFEWLDDYYAPRNRVLNLPSINFQCSITFNVCTFKCSRELNCNGLEEFLPKKFHAYANEGFGEISSDLELFSWITCAKNGVMLAHAFNDAFVRNIKFNYEQVLLSWLGNLDSSMSVNPLDRISLISTTILLVMGITFEELDIKQKSFLELIFKIIDISDLGKEDLSRLSLQINRRCQEIPKSKIQMPKPEEALHYLFKHICHMKPNVEWIFSLPLYWLLLDVEVPQKNKKAKDIVFENACLPKFSDVDWKRIMQVYTSNDSNNRRQILSLAEKMMNVSAVHPWMIKTYQFFLKNEEVVGMMQSPTENGILALFPLESVFSQFLQWLKVKPNDDKKAKCEEFIKNQLEEITEQTDCKDEDRQQELYSLCCSMLQSCNSYLTTSPPKSIEWAIDTVMLRCVRLANGLNVVDTKKLVDIFQSFIGIVQKRIKKPYVQKADIQFWGKLLSSEFQHEVLQCLWRNEILQGIKQTLDAFHSKPEDFMKFLMFYVNDLKDEEIHPEISAFFNEKLSACVARLQEASKAKNASFMKRLRFWEEKSLLDPKVIKVFEKWFSKEHGDVKLLCNNAMGKKTVSLRVLCEWSFSAEFYKIFGKEKFKNFDAKLRQLAVDVSKHFVSIAYSMLKKVVTAEHLEIIYNNKEQFLSVCQILVADKDMDPKRFTEVIELCHQHLQAFMVARKTVQDFIDVCDKARLETTPHKRLINAMKKNYKCENVIGCLTKEVDGELSCCEFFGVYSEQMSEFQKTSALKESVIFTEKYYQALCEVAQNAADIDEVVDVDDTLRALRAVEETLMRLLENICEGSISMADVVAEFGGFKGKTEETEKEVDVLIRFHSDYHGEMADDHNIGSRKKQITNALQSREANSAIDILLRLKDMLGMDGDFKDLITRREMMEKQAQVQLKDIPIEIKNADVSNITQKQSKILEGFMEGAEMVQWIQDEMPSIREVGVMCQLALISAGENTMDVDKVSSFLRAVTDFAPLIFWKEHPQANAGQPDAGSSNENLTCGSKMLLEKCKQVWENADHTEGLLNKWNDTCREIEWMKKVKNFHGSVEKSSLSQVQMINEEGIYKISGNGRSIPTVGDCVQLQLPGSESKMNFEDLRELQSRLMLIAREAYTENNSVDVFMDVLSSVEKLAKTYVKLALSGCMLFAEFQAIVSCHAQKDSASSDNINIAIQFVHKAPAITGCGTHRDLDRITEVLKEVHHRWNDHVSKMRMTHYNLNEFNIQQIMLLCHDLAEFHNGEELSNQAKSLLSFIRENISDDMLKSCFDEAKLKIQRGVDVIMEERSDSPLPPSGDTEMEDVDPDVAEKEEWNKKNNAVRKLVTEFDITEKMAKAAIQKLGYEDMTECWMWVEEGELNEAEIQELVNEFESQEIPMEDECTVIHSAFSPNADRNTIENVIRNLRASTENVHVTDQIKTVCEGYFDETLGLDLDDHLSVSMLGELLDALSQESMIHRPLLPGLQQKKPNVIITSGSEIIPNVLMVYMYDAEQPLPTRSEVLICSADTSKDEVKRFLLRAICQYQKSGRRIFTLAFADRLRYSASSAFEDMYYNLIKDGKVDDNFQLVILLSNQQCHLASSFEKNVVDGQWIVNPSGIQKYLQQHLQVTNVQVGAQNFVVKVVSSCRSGVGKSLYIQRLGEALQETAMDSQHVTVRFLESKVNIDSVIVKLCRIEDDAERGTVLIHMDITPAVQHGSEAFAFNLFVLGSIEGSDGTVWRKKINHLYAVEILDFGPGGEERFSNRHILKLLPNVICEPPLTVLEKNLQGAEHIGMDEKNFLSETFQRPFQYLLRYRNNEDVENFRYETPNGNPDSCIRVLLQYCCLADPSWAQLHDFCSFLNVQLLNCENSVYCSNPHFKEALPNLKLFAVKFMIQMAQDFATPSLVISDTSVRDTNQGFQGHQLRRKWEESSHPYVFFNEDCHTMSFINVKIDVNGYLLDANGRQVDGMTQPVATPNLVEALKRQKIDLNTDFNTLPREEKLLILSRVLGLRNSFDPDPTYELTTDNVLKMLAVYMRFRCQIPVIIMGETGCGKTRLVEFLSKFKEGPNQNSSKMTTLKIHGGVTVSDIHRSVKTAQVEARKRPNTGLNVLFYDEANTTEAIYAIKEVMSDKSIDGHSYTSSNIQIVAACNPYKKLPEEAIKKLEDSGLGYRIHTSDTTHLFGNVPVRQLVYRVVALPPSIQPYVWDFGQLSDEAEKMYIEQMTRKLTAKLQLSQNTRSMITKVLSDCQIFMRNQNNECRYVSLRDVERCMTTYEWFFQKQDVIYKGLPETISKKISKRQTMPDLHPETRTLIQTVGVCYHASLDNREEFLQNLANSLRLDDVDQEYLTIELEECQKLFSKNIDTGDNVAKNEALCENIFMMAVCADMQIPLFLIGKPGSSKSLAKTIIADNMRGKASHARLYKHLKQIQMQSFQCSAFTDVKGIETAFSQCAQIQKKLDPKTCTGVVVLDEIGLAEDSPNMPLKILHPLLERRSPDLQTVQQSQQISQMEVLEELPQQVGFIGISNWALDPAKMNRGIFITRTKPSEADLMNTGEEIFQRTPGLWKMNEELLEELTRVYLEIYDNQEVEYYGLRDYYSMMKMLAQSKNKEISIAEVDNAVLRNFSGAKEDVTSKFLDAARQITESNDSVSSKNMAKKMIRDNLNEKNSRYMLLLVEQFSVSSLLKTCICDIKNDVQVVFGSSFPNDLNYTDVCRNIKHVKGCMETGKTVILLNMSEIHESLYDALNQHYVTFGNQKYVDLGLGGHLVKCRIAENFRLIIVERHDTVFDTYPIPLINRLEKHHFHAEVLLDENQLELSKELKKWFKNFTYDCFNSYHAMIGFHKDTVSSVVLMSDRDFDQCKEVLLNSCSIDAILRLERSTMHDSERIKVQNTYFEDQHHDNIMHVLRAELHNEDKLSVLLVTSYSNVLPKKYSLELCKALDISEGDYAISSLEHFSTEQQFSKFLDQFFEKSLKQERLHEKKLLLIQCSQPRSKSSLFACAWHSLMNRVDEVRKEIDRSDVNPSIVVAFIISTEREGMSHSNNDYLALQHTQDVKIIYADELRSVDGYALSSKFFQMSLHQLFEIGKQSLDADTSQTSLLDVKTLLVESVCASLTKVKDHPSCHAPRHLKRIEILMQLCQDIGGINETFREIILCKLVGLYQSEEAREHTNNWIQENACDMENLQEGGTFRKTIWLCLKKHMSRFLGFLVSVIDCCRNMDIIANPDQNWKIDMWLDMLNVVEVKWDTLIQTNAYQIRKYGNLTQCKMPYSFVIIDFFETQWNALNTRQDIEEKFLRLFSNSNLRKPIEKASKRSRPEEFTRTFIADLIGCLHETEESAAPAEVKLIQDILYQLTISNFKKIRQAEYFCEGGILAVAYLTFKVEMMMKLKPLAKMLREIPTLTENIEKWKIKQMEEFESGSTEFKIHIYAFQDALNQLKSLIKDLDNIRVCQEWLKLSLIIKGMYSSMERNMTDREAVRRIQEDWKTLSLLDLFLVCMVPPIHPKDRKCQNYLKVFGPQAKKFWEIMKKSDLVFSLKFMRLTFNQLSLKILLDWKDPKCGICHKKIGDPIILPCQHFGCKTCVTSHLLGNDDERQCFSCAALIPDDFTPTVAVLSDATVKKMKGNFTSFFLEYFERYIYNKSDCNTEIKQILANITGNSATKLDFTSLDININSKSYMLRILLKADEKLTASEIDSQLGDIENKGPFVLVVLKTLEMKVLSIMEKYDEEKLSRHCQELLKSGLDDLQRRHEEPLSFAMLKSIVNIRCSLFHLASFLEKFFKGGRTSLCRETSNFLQLSRIYIAQDVTPKILKKYLIKIGCHRFGTQWLFQLNKDDEMKDLIPRALRQAAASPQVDYWVLSGEEYKTSGNKLFHSDDYDYDEVIDELLLSCSGLTGVLAIASWSASKSKGINSSVEKLLTRKFSGHVFVDYVAKFRSELKYLLESTLPMPHQVQVIYQLMVLVLASLDVGNSILEGFQKLLVRPDMIPQLFLPTMPEDPYFSAPSQFRKDASNQNSMYRCPNGHLYSIGDCTRPYVTSTCPDCKATIGGKQHKAAVGNERVQKDDSSQAGYLLNNGSIGYISSGSERMSPQGDAVTQFYLHSCLLAAAIKSPIQLQSSLQITGDDDVRTFLIKKLQTNLDALAKSLARNQDDAVLVMHNIIWNIIRQGPKLHPESWANLDSRKAWEQTFRNNYLLPIFQNVDVEIAQAKTIIRQATASNRLPLNRVLDETDDDDVSDLVCEESSLWKVIEHPTSAHLLQQLEDSEDGDRGDVIKIILRTSDLMFTRYLENVLALQSKLIAKYENQLDMNETEAKTLKEHLSDGEYDDKELIEEYIVCWNEVYPRLMRSHTDMEKNYFFPMSLYSPLAMLLPSSKGMGLCAKVLSEYLIEVQNIFLTECVEKMTPSHKIPEVDTAQMTSTDFIQMDKTKDLLPLINMHTRYTVMTSGQGQKQHLISYNIEALEKQVREKYVMRKKLISKKSLPLMNYPQDIGIGSDWSRVETSIQQKRLTEKMKQDLDRTVKQSLLPDICEGVRTLANTIIFLGKVPTESSKKLSEFLKRDLKIPESQATMIPDSAEICHVLALYNRLSWQKAIRFVQQRLKPFKAVLSTDDQEKITLSLCDETKAALKETNVALLQQKINEMIIRAPGIYNREWSLSEVFPAVVFLEDDQDDSWHSKLPDGLCVKHLMHLFELSVKSPA